MTLDRILAPLQTQLAPARERYAALQPRERKMLWAVAIVIALALVFLIVWQPAVDARSRNMAALRQARATATRIEQLAIKAPAKSRSASTTAAADAGRSLLTIVDLSSRKFSGLKAPSRLQPDGQHKVRIWFEKTSFANLMQWLAQLHGKHGITVANADITRGNAPGLVDARFSLQGKQ